MKDKKTIDQFDNYLEDLFSRKIKRGVPEQSFLTYLENRLLWGFEKKHENSRKGFSIGLPAFSFLYAPKYVFAAVFAVIIIFSGIIYQRKNSTSSLLLLDQQLTQSEADLSHIDSQLNDLSETLDDLDSIVDTDFNQY